MLRFLRIAPLALAALTPLTAGSCGSDDAAPGFSLRLALDDSAEGATCVSAEGPAPSCVDFALFCDAFVGIRVVELDDDGASGAVLSSTCVPAASSVSATLCDLANLDVSLSESVELPRRLLRFEITVWRADQLAEPEECPFDDVAYDLAGRPRTDAGGAVPAFGRRVELDLGSDDPDARVELACINPAELADQSCLPTTVKATLFDLEQLAIVSGEQLSNVAVGLGIPERQASGFVIEDADTQPLGLIAPEGLAPFFRATVPRIDEGGDVCVLVTESVARTTTALTCLQAPAGEINADAYLLRRNVLDSLLAAAELAFPPEGLVVGRAVAADTKLPVAGIAVSPSDPEVEVIYIDAELGGVHSEDRTSASGFFLARDVAFQTMWTAAGGGLEVTEPVRGGVVQNRATVLYIELAPAPQ